MPRDIADFCVMGLSCGEKHLAAEPARALEKRDLVAASGGRLGKFQSSDASPTTAMALAGDATGSVRMV
jgi:hypothetical protein